MFGLLEEHELLMHRTAGEALGMVKRYRSGETLAEIASAVDKTPNSIRGKLVSEGVYTEYKEINFRLSQMDNANLEQLIVKEGMEYSFGDMLQYLHEAGYLRVSRVTQQGYYSVKGGVIQLDQKRQLP